MKFIEKKTEKKVLIIRGVLRLIFKKIIKLKIFKLKKYFLIIFFFNKYRFSLTFRLFQLMIVYILLRRINDRFKYFIHFLEPLQKHKSFNQIKSF